MKITSPPAHPFAKIKDLWLEVANCDFFHSHLGEKDSGFFLGRKKAKEHLKMLLRHSKSRSGAYLVAGFRGMGKTSLVHEVLEELKKECGKERPFEKIPISLSQDDIRDMDVLRLIARQMASKWKERYFQKSWWYWIPRWGAVGVLFFLAVWLFVWLGWVKAFLTKASDLFREDPWFYGCLAPAVVLAGLLFLRVTYHWLYGQIIGKRNYRRIRQRLDFLNARLDALLTQEKGASFSPEAKTNFGIKVSLFSTSSKSAQSFKIATAKEIEKELIGIFNDIEDYRGKPVAGKKLTGWQRLGIFFRVIHHVPEFVFILDELDKIEPDFVTTPVVGDSKHSATIAQNTQRRETIARLLSNLKSFLNEAKAKFIFVGGREMYDASLADIADRDSFYGSIFHDVIYLNSFFKDKIQHRSGVTRVTEAYLCHLLIPHWYIENFKKYHPDKDKVRETDKDEWYSLDTLYHYLVDCQRQSTREKVRYKYWKAVFAHGAEKEPIPSDRAAVYKIVYMLRNFGIYLTYRSNGAPKKAEKEPTPGDRAAVYKIIYTLQNFVIYLTYRSNGTPKKLAGLLEQYILPGVKDRTPGDSSEGSFLCDRGFNPFKRPKGEFGNEIILFCPPDPEKRRWFSFFSTQPVQHLVAGKLFLKFTFNQQYEIGLTSNLYRPYVIIHSRYLKALGDKLLYSTAFIMDYILKFHPHGFSWRNLEMVPDIILTNKDPNLRTFMQELLQFLSRMYIRETINGMFQYRFYSKVVNEIRFLSKISEQGSAAYNFTLDESQQIKHYYRDKLHRQLKQHEGPVQFSHGDAPFVHSIAFLRNLLGDLHYYDKEYDDAIIHYSDAAQPLRERALVGNLSNHQVVLLVRTQLKLGMALERIKAFDSAYSIYRSLIMDTPRLLKLEKTANDPKREEGSGDMPQLLAPPYITTPDTPRLLKPEETGRGSKAEDGSGDMPLSRMQLLVRPYIAILDLVEKQRIDGITFSNLRKNLSDLNILLDVNRPYPILAPGKAGEYKDNHRLNTLYSDYFSNVGSILYFKNFNFPEVYEDFRRGLTQDKWGKHHKEGFSELRPSNLAAFIEKHRGKNDEGKPLFDYNPTLSAYIYYRQAITEQVATFRGGIWAALEEAEKMDSFKEHKGQDLQEALLMLHPAAGYLTNSTQMFIMGNLLSKLGDAVLSSTGGDVKPLSQQVLDLYEKDDSIGSMDTLLSECLKGLCHPDFPFDDGINSALLLYRISGLFYLKANRSFSCAFQFKKFLFVTKDWLAFKGQDWVVAKEVPEEKKEEDAKKRKELLNNLDRLLIIDVEKDGEPRKPSIASRLFRSIVWSSDVANRPQLLKYREIFNIERTQDTASIYNNISTSPEMREVVLLIEEIRLKLSSLGVLEEPLHLNLITPYDSISSKYLRVLELKYKCEYNFARFKDMGAKKLSTFDYYKGKGEEKHKETPPFEQLQQVLRQINDEGGVVDDDAHDAVEACVLDSIFCLYEVVRSLNIYGMNYVTNHSFLANAHYKLANWCRAFQNLKYGHMEAFKESQEAKEDPWKVRDESQKFDGKLIKLLGTDALYALEVNYHNEQALEHYYAAIQTHKGGRSYRDNISNMSFLEDDLNDNLTHFSAAAERFRINIGVIRQQIGKLKGQVSDSQVYDFESYTGTPPGDA